MKVSLKRYGPIALIAVLALALAPQAFATAQLRISDGLGNTIDILDNGVAVCAGAVTGCADANGSGDVVTYVGSIGTWSLNVSTGASHGALVGTDLDLNSINNTSGPGTLTIQFSDDGFAPIATGYNFHVGGTLSGAPATLTFSQFSAAAKFGTTTQLGTDLVFTASPFAGTMNGASLAGQGALTEVAVLSFTGAGGTSFDAALAPVPEPASVALFGGVLLLSVGAIRRKMRRQV